MDELPQPFPVICAVLLDVKVSKEVEKDPTRIAARLKQIAFGKNTVGYDNYVVAVPKEKRGGYQEHPRTPDAYEAQSKRAFDGKVKAWRRGIHHWDTLDGATGDMDAGKVTSSPMKVEAQEAGASGAASSPGGVSALLLSGAKCTDSVPAPTFYTAEQVLQLASANDDELADYSEDEEDVL